MYRLDWCSAVTKLNCAVCPQQRAVHAAVLAAEQQLQRAAFQIEHAHRR